MDELSELTHMLQAQMAGDAPVTREQVEKWHEYYPYFSLPLLLYLRQCSTPDTDMCARATAWMGDLESLATLTGRMEDFTGFYPSEQQTCAETTDDAIELFLQTYGKEDADDEHILVAGNDVELQQQDTLLENPVPTVVEPEREPVADEPFVAIPAYDYTGMLESMPDAADASPMQGDDLLSRFIEADESGERMFLKPSATGNRPQPAAVPEMEKEVDSEPLFTESLAKIYIKQRKYAKALEIIRKLSLNNPEKNIYFADQIRFLEKLIINIKN